MSDNGIGLPDNFDKLLHKSLGIQLVKTLVRQMKGTLQSSDQTGAVFEVQFHAKENNKLMVVWFGPFLYFDHKNGGYLKSFFEIATCWYTKPIPQCACIGYIGGFWLFNVGY